MVMVMALCSHLSVQELFSRIKIEQIKPKSFEDFRLPFLATFLLILYHQLKVYFRICLQDHFFRLQDQEGFKYAKGELAIEHSDLLLCICESLRALTLGGDH
ncbi:hypothetical protein QQP08_005850 [Theobroma cacao]|nr:hypothetical protein QQP08_005850 [Theobroma cacao]